jgi:alcohol dehydrogenase (cytochrome c)
MHARASQLTPQTVDKLTLQWTLQTDVPGFPGRGIETTPLVVDGVMYVTGNGNTAWALDARTGHRLWTYERALPANFAASICCGPVNRGFAVLGDRLYMGTLDGYLIALDRKVGTVVWQAEVGDLKSANPITMAP